MTAKPQKQNVVFLHCTLVDNWGDIGSCNRLVISMIRIFAKKAKSTEFSFVYMLDTPQSVALAQKMSPELKKERLGKTKIRLLSEQDSWPEELPAPSLLIETFSSGIPQAIKSKLQTLHEDQRSSWVSVDYLSAESWVDEMNRMPSLSSLSAVDRVMLFPGFSPSSAGLCGDDLFLHAAKRCQSSARKQHQRLKCLVFSYERDQRSLLKGLKQNSRWELIACNGRSQDSCIEAQKVYPSVPIVPLPFLPQRLWDKMLLTCDAALVRGEESLSRVSLAGLPFVWQAYPQEEGHHRVKVKALLEKMERIMLGVLGNKSLWDTYCRLCEGINDREADTAALSPRNPETEDWNFFFRYHFRFKRAFAAWGAYCRKLPRLEREVLSFMPKTE